MACFRAAQADDGGPRDAGKPRPDRGVRGGGATCCWGVPGISYFQQLLNILVGLWHLDLVGILPDSTAVDDLMWLRQGRKIHLIKEEPDGGHPIPWCRDKAFAQEPQQRGRGFTHNLPIRHFARGVSLECPEGCTPRWLTTMAGCIDSQPVYERKKGCQPLLVCVALSQPPVGLMSLFFHDRLHAVEVFYFMCFV